MLKFRLIARLDIKPPHLIKTVRLDGVRKVGDPAEYARRYNDEGIDEVVFLDVVASLYRRNGLHSLCERVTTDVFCPVGAGGGVRSVADALSLLRSGADKIVVNTAAVERPGLIDDLANKIGSQSVVLQLDAKRHDRGWQVLTDGGRQETGLSAVDWAKTAIGRGAGEILCTSADHEGVGDGFDLDLTGEIASLPVPVIAAGGFGKPDDAAKAWKAGASGVAIAGALHYGRTTLADIRRALANAGVPVREAA